MTGWRIGASIGPRSILKQMARFNINDESCTNHFIQLALASVLVNKDDDGRHIIERLRKRRNLSVEKLNSIDGIDIPHPDSTFYLFPNVTKIMDKKGYNSLEKIQPHEKNIMRTLYLIRDIWNLKQLKELQIELEEAIVNKE